METPDTHPSCPLTIAYIFRSVSKFETLRVVIFEETTRRTTELASPFLPFCFPNDGAP